MGFGKNVKTKNSEVKTIKEATRQARNKRINALVRRYCENVYMGYKESNGDIRKKMRKDCWINIIAPYVKSKTSIDLMTMQQIKGENYCNIVSYDSLIYNVSNDTEKYEKVARCITDLCNKKRIVFLDICSENGDVSPIKKDELLKEKEIENIDKENQIKKLEKDLEKSNTEIEKCYTIIRLLNLKSYEWCTYRFLLVLIERLKNAITDEECYSVNVDPTNWNEKYEYTWELFEKELLYRQGIDLLARIEERGHGDITTYIDKNELPFVASVVVGTLERRNIKCDKMIEHAKNNDYPNDISNLDYIYKH